MRLGFCLFYFGAVFEYMPSLRVDGTLLISTRSKGMPISSSIWAFRLRYSLKVSSGSAWIARSMSLMLSRRVKLPKSQADWILSSLARNALSLAIRLAFCFCPIL